MIGTEVFAEQRYGVGWQRRRQWPGHLSAPDGQLPHLIWHGQQTPLGHYRPLVIYPRPRRRAQEFEARTTVAQASTDTLDSRSPLHTHPVTQSPVQTTAGIDSFIDAAG